MSYKSLVSTLSIDGRDYQFYDVSSFGQDYLRLPFCLRVLVNNNITTLIHSFGKNCVLILSYLSYTFISVCYAQMVLYQKCTLKYVATKGQRSEVKSFKSLMMGKGYEQQNDRYTWCINFSHIKTHNYCFKTRLTEIVQKSLNLCMNYLSCNFQFEFEACIYLYF